MPNAVRRRKLGLSPIVTSANAPDFTKTRRCMGSPSGAGIRVRRVRGRPPGRDPGLRVRSELHRCLGRRCHRGLSQPPVASVASAASSPGCDEQRVLAGQEDRAGVGRCVAAEDRASRPRRPASARGAVMRAAGLRPSVECRAGDALSGDRQAEVDAIEDRTGVHPALARSPDTRSAPGVRRSARPSGR